MYKSVCFFCFFIFSCSHVSAELLTDKALNQNQLPVVLPIMPFDSQKYCWYQSKGYSEGAMIKMGNNLIARCSLKNKFELNGALIWKYDK